MRLLGKLSINLRSPFPVPSPVFPKRRHSRARSGLWACEAGPAQGLCPAEGRAGRMCHLLQSQPLAGDLRTVCPRPSHLSIQLLVQQSDRSVCRALSQVFPSG